MKKSMLIVALAYAFTTFGSAAELPTVDEIIAAGEQRRTAVENIHFVSRQFQHVPLGMFPPDPETELWQILDHDYTSRGDKHSRFEVTWSKTDEDWKVNPYETTTQIQVVTPGTSRALIFSGRKTLPGETDNLKRMIWDPEDIIRVGSIPLANALRNAQIGGQAIEIAALEDDGTALVSWTNRQNPRKSFKVFVDINRAFYPLRIEHYFDGQLNEVSESIPNEVTEGIWFPSTGTRKQYVYKGIGQELTTEDRIEITHVEINSVNITRDTFDWPPTRSPRGQS